MDSKKLKIINEYLCKYPRNSFKKGICINNYPSSYSILGETTICNYFFYEGNTYDIICHFQGLVTLIEFNDSNFESLKTFDKDDFLKYFKIISINDIRELAIDDILS